MRGPLTLRFEGTCHECGEAIPIGALAWWEPGRVSHVACGWTLDDGSVAGETRAYVENNTEEHHGQ